MFSNFWSSSSCTTRRLDLVLSLFCLRPAGNYSYCSSVHAPLCLQHSSLLLPLYCWKVPQIEGEVKRYFSSLSKTSNNFPCKNKGRAFQREATAVQRQQNRLGNLHITEQWESPCCHSKPSYNSIFCGLFLPSCPWSIIHYLCFCRAHICLHQLIIYWLGIVLSNKKSA